MVPDTLVEVAIVGGGPAGLSAALVLGRCRRRVVVFDGGHHRNDESRAVHGFLSRDGTAPAALREIARNELRRYGSVRVEHRVVTDIVRDVDGFVLTADDGDHVRARRVLLASGLVDILPPIDGARALHGRLVVPCPYCDGWEMRDRPLAVYSHADDRGARYARLVAHWSNEVVFCPGREPELSPELREVLAARSIAVDPRPIDRVDEEDGELRLVFSDGSSRRLAALFYHLGCVPGHELARRLGIELDERGGIAVDDHNATNVPGAYAAGDATRDALQAIVGAGEGAAAAVAIHQSLIDERLSGSDRSVPRRAP